MTAVTIGQFNARISISSARRQRPRFLRYPLVWEALLHPFYSSPSIYQPPQRELALESSEERPYKSGQERSERKRKERVLEQPRLLPTARLSFKGGRLQRLPSARTCLGQGIHFTARESVQYQRLREG